MCFSYWASLVLKEMAKWASITVLIIGGATGINTLFPQIRGHIAMGVAAGVLLVAMYGIRRVQK